jgi:hypothetical protein
VHGTNKLTFHEQDEYQAYCEDEIVHRVLQFSGRRRTTTADQWAIASRGVIRLIRRVSFFQSLSGPLVSLLSSASPPQLRLCIFSQWSAKSRFYFLYISILFCSVLFYFIPFHSVENWSEGWRCVQGTSYMSNHRPRTVDFLVIEQFLVNALSILVSQKAQGISQRGLLRYKIAELATWSCW